MKRYLSLAVSVGLAFVASRASAEPPVWSWFATCGGPVIELQVRFDEATILEASFPVCRAPRESNSSQGQSAGGLHFTFRPERRITWSGYRDTAEQTKAGEVLTCDLWQAGADPDDLLIGVSFRTAKDVYMNTLHVAHPSSRDETQIASGLYVVTKPAAAEGANKP